MTSRTDAPRMVHVRLEPDLHRRLRMVVAAEDISVQQWMSRIVEQAIAERWPSMTGRRGA
jgi:predicted HicB family RNase H-like nuclease